MDEDLLVEEAIDPDLDDLLLEGVEEPEPEPELNVSAMDLAIKLPKPELEKFTQRVAVMLQGAIDLREQQTSWMSEIYRIDRGDAGGEPIYSDQLDAETDDADGKMHIPIAAPRLDALTANVSTIIGKQSPYLVAVEGPPERTKNEQFLHRLMRDAGFPMMIRKAAKECGLVNFAVAYVSPSIGDDPVTNLSYAQSQERQTKRSGIEFGLIRAEDFVAFGAENSGLDNALMVGHRFQMPLQMARDKVKSKEWCCELQDYGRQVGSIQLDEEGYASVTLGESAPDLDKDDNLDGANAVTFWELYVKTTIKGSYQWFRLIVGAESQKVYRIEKHPYSRHPYFSFSFLESPLGRVFPVTSIGRQLYPIQDCYDSMFTVLYQGAANSADPPAIGMPHSDKDQRYDRGQIVEGFEGVSNINFDGAYVNQSLALLERTADQVARVSQNMIGTGNSNAKTATENSIIAQNVQTSLEDLIATFSESLPAMAQYIMDEIVFNSYSEYALDYPNEIPDQMTLGGSILFEVNGKSANQTPQARVQQAQLLIELVSMVGGNAIPLVRGIISDSPYRALVDAILPELPPQPVAGPMGEPLQPGGVPVPGMGMPQVPVDGVEGGMPSTSSARGPFVEGDVARQIAG